MAGPVFTTLAQRLWGRQTKGGILANLASELLDLSPRLPCPNGMCTGWMEERRVIDAFECSKCRAVVSKIALSGMLKAVAQSNPYWSAQAKSGALTQQMLKGYMDKIVEQALEAQQEYIRIAHMDAYLGAYNERFYRAVHELAEQRGLVYGPSTLGHNSQGTYKGTAQAPPISPPSGSTETSPKNYEATVTPTSDEPVKAWRAWKVHPRRKGLHVDEPILRSITYETQWLPKRAFHARCILKWKKGQKRSTPRPLTVYIGPQQQAPHDIEYKEPEHTAPVRDCTCGVYGKTTSRGAAHWAGQPRYAGMFGGAIGGAAEKVASQVPIVGTVQMWGRVLLFSEGYRSEYAYPYHLFIPAHFNTYQEERWGTAEKLAAQLRSSYACDVEVVDFQPPDPPPGTERNPYADGGTA